jgi:hypothetical protein
MMMLMLKEKELGVVVMAVVVVGGSLCVVLEKGRVFLVVREWCGQDGMDGLILAGGAIFEPV